MPSPNSEFVAIASDPSIEGSEALFADMGQSAVSTFLDANGWQLETSRPAQILYRPGRSVLIRSIVWVTRADTSRRFTIATELNASPLDDWSPNHGHDALPLPVVRLSERSMTWAFPFDPALPDLGEVLTIEGARRLAEGVVGFPCSIRSAAVHYRPRRGAVVRYEVRRRGRTHDKPQELYLKITPPDVVERILSASRVLEGRQGDFALPVARPRAGVLVFPKLDGVPLRSVLLDGEPPPADDVAGLIRVFATLRNPGTPGPPDAVRRLRRAVRLLTVLLPERADHLRRMKNKISERIDSDRPPRTVVHGDLYEGQILVRSGADLGVLDLDDLGMGDPAMDAANLTAHLASLAESHPNAADRLHQYRREVRGSLLSLVPVTEQGLAAREAVAMLQLATGPFRVLAPDWPLRVADRIELADRLLTGR